MYVQSCGWILIIDSMYSAMSVNRDRAYPNIGHSPHFSSICIRPHTRTHTYMYTHTVHCVYIINLFIHSNSPPHTHPPTPIRTSTFIFTFTFTATPSYTYNTMSNIFGFGSSKKKDDKKDHEEFSVGGAQR